MTERRPLIGVTTQSLQAVEGIPAAFPASWVMNRMYLDALARAGAAPVLLPLLPEQPQVMRALYEHLDGLLLPGGVDIEPSNFGEAPHPLLRRTDPPRDVVELLLARWALEDGMPVLGLCRGLQILNIAAGGSLFQDVQAQRFGSQKHDYEPPDHTRDFLAHDVALVSGSRLHALVGAASAAVNSMHHQGIQRLGAGLAATAHAPDGLIEAIEGEGSAFAVAVQWHPESLEPSDEVSRALFREFVTAAGAS
jgi:putative glutamine amidotransferase